MAASRPNTSRVGMPGPYSPHRTRTSGDISHYAPPNIKLVGPQADDLETLIRHYDTLLDIRDNQIMQLTSQLESEQRRASMLESELGLALAASSRAEAAHASELAKVEGDVARVLAERRGLLEKLQGIEVVEDAVREMVVQMKFRVGDDERPTPEQLQSEKEALRDENILTVLGSLKATLKTLWTFKVEAEEDMRCSRLGRQNAHTQQVLGLKAQIREMEAAVRQAQQQEQAARAMAEGEAAAREAVLEESRQVLAAMEAAQREVLAALRGATEEAAAARRALAAAQEEGRRRDGLVLKNQQLESARHFDRVAQDRELRLMQTAHTRQIAAMQSELGRISDLMLQNDQLRDRLRRALGTQEQLAGQVRTAAARQDLALRRQRSLPRGSQFDAASLHSSISFTRPASAAAALATFTTGPGANGGNAAAAGRGSLSGAATPMPGGGGGGGGGPGSTATGGGGRGRARLASAMAVMASRRAKAEEKAKAEADMLESQDPVYQTLVNVNKLHRGVRNQIREVKRELSEAQPSWSRLRQAQSGGGRG
ncbi:hypothetical protein PLESTB_000682700 [Pleodorina starrii]|uniref:Uncharacterized protein n=1 Tax=Pleodorina starrii TaxID=330485 RepID=A0A9W6BJB1_9CHLO|nr:hypothetical protein PLESTM_001234300 [Pleodorina starrii]GLC52868.1 hypothetical protein PLESTB_000682700 [Pleodorina starrii]GLC65171.1 hypothetical protein PLESTF_000259800 [Pleodorina starrii]